jgi:eukaryotic-like serine/threonine-protein kinase
VQEVQTTLTTGTVIQNRYVVEDLLGKGGFGAVYLVRDMRVRSNLFAMKEIIDPSKRDRKQFLFEGELLKKLDHPALPRVYRVFENEPEKRVYLLMDYVAGPNLEHLRQEQPEKHFPLSEVLHIMAPIMDAVSYLHSQNPPILHRDIKPANIIVPRVGDEPVLVDFGIAKPYNPDATTTAVRRASPGYGAPEQYSKGTNTRTDIYGLGATLYALLTGEVPVDAFTRMTALGSSSKDPLEPAKSLVPAIPQHVSDAIQRAMDINNENRFATVEQFWQALNARPMRQFPTMVIANRRPDGTEAETTYPEAANAGVAAVAATPEKPIEERTTQPRKPGNGLAAGAVGAATTQRRRARGLFPLLLVLLALLVGLATGAAAWSLLAGHPTSTPSVAHRVTSPTPTHKTSPTATPTKKPAPTAKPTSAPAVVPTTAPTPVPTSPPPTPVPTSPPATPTPIPPMYPNVAGQYSGNIHNTTVNISSTMSLSVQQNGANISGYFTVNQPLQGSNPFTGTVTTGKYIAFTVQSYRGNAPLFFWGYVQNGSMSGQYCSLDATGHCNANAGGAGTWNVTGTSPGGS